MPMQPRPKAETLRPLWPSLRVCMVGLLEDVAPDLQRRHRRRPAGIEGEMRDRSDDFVAGDAVLQRPLEMERDFVDPVERDKAGDSHRAPVARRQGRVFTEVAK